MCIALAWPPQPTANNARVLETVRTTKPRPIQHNDIHDGNGKWREGEIIYAKILDN